MSLIRIAGAAALVLSFGLLIHAMPVPQSIEDLHIKVCVGVNVVVHALHKMVVDGDLESKIKAMAHANTAAELKACVAVLVRLLAACTSDLVKIGANVSINADERASIVGCIASTIVLLVRVCAHVSVKLGINAVATVFADLDVHVRDLLVNLNICVGGILELIVKACVSLTVGFIDSVKLHLIAKVCAQAGLQY
ncbi:hypothetical protein RhiXN_03566 [Rhizoctonia solani]|uniref:Transmembrane protein n=1 Tax=Rhizoctonia solani TaxID=456999 RepID=A0A8H8NLS0_9AGAM|nr:uncharacterized protein RhiXN_03566 [Rhizoctonia solani]QRW15565.1 hypothetical protein RhiXN_03566 [Rhizoctonia solani]